MKKRIVSVLLVLTVLFATGIVTLANKSNNSSPTEALGKSIQKYVNDFDTENAAVKKSLNPLNGNEIILPQNEIDMAKDFYIATGYEEDVALNFAIEYVKDINTLYQEALKNGYSVTQNEINEHLNQMKIEFQTAENKEEIYSYIDLFESEAAYWEFQFEMFKKDLPIQKYISDKEYEFINKNLANELSGKAYSNQAYYDKMAEFQEAWIDEFENLKNEAKRNYDFIIE